MIIVGKCTRTFGPGECRGPGAGIVLEYPTAHVELRETVFIKLWPRIVFQREGFVGQELAIECHGFRKDLVGECRFQANAIRLTTADKAADLLQPKAPRDRNIETLSAE